MGFRTKAGELKHKAGRWMQRADQLDQRMQTALDEWIERGVSLEPIDLRKAVLRDIGNQLVTVRPGKRSFPFKFVAIEFFAPDETRQAIFETAFVEGQQLQGDVQNFLRQELGDAPTALRIAVTAQIPPPPANAAFRISYRRTTSSETPRAQLIVVKGRALCESYVLDKERICIGRLPEVTDQAGRLVRRNDIVFTDDDHEANQTVSRVHAHIRYDAASGEYRICDDLSGYGTRVVREGQPYEVPQRRGVKLKDGDEIYLGEACVRFEYEIE